MGQELPYHDEEVDPPPGGRHELSRGSQRGVTLLMDSALPLAPDRPLCLSLPHQLSNAALAPTDDLGGGWRKPNETRHGKRMDLYGFIGSDLGFCPCNRRRNRYDCIDTKKGPGGCGEHPPTRGQYLQRRYRHEQSYCRADTSPLLVDEAGVARDVDDGAGREPRPRRRAHGGDRPVVTQPLTIHKMCLSML